jgi:hypothetical protein
MSRRRDWLRLRGGAVSAVAEPSAAGAVPAVVFTTDDAELAALLEKSNARNRELCEQVSRLRAQLTIQIVRADDAERALGGRDDTIRGQSQAIDNLERDLVRAREGQPTAQWNGTAGVPKAGTEAEHWYRVAHELQERLVLLQAANQGYDRAARGGR